MRRVAVLCSLVMVAACTGGETAGTTVLSTTTTAISTNAVVPTSTTPTQSSTTSTIPQVLPPLVFSVELLGPVPEESFGATPALGSGCSPGTERLPDGVWFGWLAGDGEGTIEFDLACFWGGRLEPAVQNESARIRTVGVHSSARVSTGDADLVAYSEWTPTEDPVWVFVNDGVLTEIAGYDSAIRWARSRSAWPEDMSPGCCDGGTVAPPSPADPWPEVGWPADGFYEVWVAAHGDGFIDAEIVRWHDCDERPDLCAEWWVGDEVSYDPLEERLPRRINLDEDLTVVIAPIPQGDDSVLVGNGAALADLLGDLRRSIDEFSPDLGTGQDDPAHPFGLVLYNGEIEDFGYRGPGGSVLTVAEGGLWWWHVLEIRDGKPILYLHAGIIAG